jgi:hypothetical protein
MTLRQAAIEAVGASAFDRQLGPDLTNCGGILHVNTLGGVQFMREFMAFAAAAIQAFFQFRPFSLAASQLVSQVVAAKPGQPEPQQTQEQQP